ANRRLGVPGTRSMCVRVACKSLDTGLLACEPLLIKDEGFADTELDNRHQQDDHEEHCRYSGGVAQLDVLECRLVDEHDDGAGGVARPTLDHEKRLAENLEAA